MECCHIANLYEQMKTIKNKHGMINHQSLNLSSPPLKMGDVIGEGKYRIISDTKNAGGFGRIYRAKVVRSSYRHNINRIVAIKEFHIHEYAQDSTSSLLSSDISESTRHQSMKILLEQFRIESKILHELSKQRDCHIPQLYHSAKIDQGRYFYAMNYIDGPTLTEVINEHGAMKEDVAVGYIAQIAKVLYKTHRWNLLHNDISPNNIMLENGIAVLVDFGNARGYTDILQRKGDTQEMIQAAEHITKMFSDIGIGTPCFAAPNESFRGTPQGDIYSLAATLYFLLTGEKPVVIGGGARTYENIENCLAERNISKATTKAILHAMTPNIQDCTRDARQFLKEMPNNIVFETLLNYNDYDYNRRR